MHSCSMDVYTNVCVCCVYIHVYIPACTMCLYMYIHAYTFAYFYLYTHVYTCMQCVCTYMYSILSEHVNTCMQVYLYKCTHEYTILCVYTCICMHTHLATCTYITCGLSYCSPPPSLSSFSLSLARFLALMHLSPLLVVLLTAIFPSLPLVIYIYIYIYIYSYIFLPHPTPLLFQMENIRKDVASGVLKVSFGPFVCVCNCTIFVTCILYYIYIY